MTPREERGLVIAALCKLKFDNGEWVVPSQTGTDKLYRVNANAGTCTCPDHAETGTKCKHVFAVEFTMRREVASDGTVTETNSITFTEKKTYKQDWPALPCPCGSGSGCALPPLKSCPTPGETFRSYHRHEK